MRRTTLLGLAAVALLGLAAFFALRAMQPAEAGKPTDVDIGFAQDMIIHHRQAIVMASYTRQHTRSDRVRMLAATIGDAQQREVGQMVGWLQSWGEPTESDHVPMYWMGSGAAHGDHSAAGQHMPGMASPAQLDALVNLTGRRLDTRFLMLMTRHHEGGLTMAKDAAVRAGTAYVRDTARMMIRDQQSEIDQMQALRDQAGD